MGVSCKFSPANQSIPQPSPSHPSPRKWQGLVYVVDSSDTRRLEESSRELKQLLAEEKLAGIPTLAPWLGMGVGGWVGLGLGEGNSYGKFWKYIRKYLGGHLSESMSIGNSVVAHWCMENDGDEGSAQYSYSWWRTFCAYMCRPFVVCSNKFVLTLFSIDFKFYVQYKICSIFQ